MLKLTSTHVASSPWEVYPPVRTYPVCPCVPCRKPGNPSKGGVHGTVGSLPTCWVTRTCASPPTCVDTSNTDLDLDLDSALSPRVLDTYCRYRPSWAFDAGMDSVHQAKLAWQTQQQIQGSVGMAQSTYVATLGPLSTSYTRTPWHPQSDQPHPSVLQTVVPSHGNSRRTTRTSDRPGSQYPGGTGCDLKHNAYTRYLLRLVAQQQSREPGLTQKACLC